MLNRSSAGELPVSIFKLDMLDILFEFIFRLGVGGNNYSQIPTDEIFGMPL